MADKYYKLQGSDEEIIEVEESAVMMSTTLREKLAQNGGAGGGDGQQAPIQIENITGAILRMVFCWCEHHSYCDKPKDEEDEDDEPQPISAWDKDFLSVELSTRFEITLAAHALGIKRLLDQCCKTIAGMMRGKTPQEIRETFGLENDIPPEEEERIRREWGWLNNEE